jgi:hypothetical protein
MCQPVQGAGRWLFMWLFCPSQPCYESFVKGCLCHNLLIGRASLLIVSAHSAVGPVHKQLSCDACHTYADKSAWLSSLIGLCSCSGARGSK